MDARKNESAFLPRQRLHGAAVTAILVSIVPDAPTSRQSSKAAAPAFASAGANIDEMSS
jgi:hypothetical protein